MKIRPAKLEDTTEIAELLSNAYGQSRFDRRFAPHWVNCFVTNPLILPSFVAIDESGTILGYIVWRIRQVSDDHRLTIELQELTANNGSNKLEIERLLFDESPKQIVDVIKKLGFEVGEKCNLYIWIHHQDAHNDKSVFFNPQKAYGDFLGGFERSDARGGMMILYRQTREIF